MSLENVWFIATFGDWAKAVVDQWPLTSMVWITAVGACIGSFMNVVIYRLPAGMSLVHPPSHCPNCERPIRARDNLPVIGWLILRGRCRDCHCAIPVRYPLVEAAVALTFLILWLVDVVWPGAEMVTSVRLGVFALHTLLLCTLICIALIRMDGQVIPWRLMLPAVVVLSLTAWLAPYLIDDLQRHQHEMLPLGGISGGAVAGGVLGWLSSGLGRGVARRRSALMAGILTGAYLSWTAVSLIASVTAVLVVFTRRMRSATAPRGPLLFTVATLLLLVGDRLFFPTPPGESLSVGLWIFIVAIVLTTMSGRLAGD